VEIAEESNEDSTAITQENPVQTGTKQEEDVDDLQVENKKRLNNKF